jgi:hypothetical protein
MGKEVWASPEGRNVDDMIFGVGDRGSLARDVDIKCEQKSNGYLFTVGNGEQQKEIHMINSAAY